ncbi:pyridoxamine 5'-phosphate oxidase [Promineifilum sp.]|uniref:pyridoxamine 5'-phosphate oxidase family protein n=1 Tax=Promineifilum sp. TaxID=2664178 RepID=UPI0035B34D75
MSWRQLAAADPELAAFGKERLHDRVAYLATLRQDGSPRLHPVRPILSDTHLFIFMASTSPKRHDLARDGRYALHGTITNPDGGPWEFYEFSVEGWGVRIEDPAIRQQASAATAYPRDETFILFELSVERAFSTVYGADGQPVRRRWPAT